MNSATAFLFALFAILFLLAVHVALWCGLFWLIVWAFDLPFTWLQIGVVALIFAIFTSGR